MTKDNTLIFLLHAHMPYVIKTKGCFCLNERWLYESMLECYIPLIISLKKLATKGFYPNLTLSISPTLIEMLNDDYFHKKFLHYLKSMQILGRKEMLRSSQTPLKAIITMYLRRVNTVLKYFQKCNILADLKDMHKCNCIELITTCATHAYLPACEHTTVKDQINVGIHIFKRHFGFKPNGFWLPECGYSPNALKVLYQSKINYFFIDPASIVSLPASSIFLPFKVKKSLHTFVRDTTSCKKIWCAKTGFPSSPYYRDFYRDIGFDMPPSYTGLIRPAFTGFKYYSITGDTDDKTIYDISTASRQMLKDVKTFVNYLQDRFTQLQQKIHNPTITLAFDAELFGHWWHEGIQWLISFIKYVCNEHINFALTLPSQALLRNTEHLPTARLQIGSWGKDADSSTWINEKTAHYYKTLRQMRKIYERLKLRLHQKHRLDKLHKELLLAESSDWMFMITNNRCVDYAHYRLQRHIGCFFNILKEFEKH